MEYGAVDREECVYMAKLAEQVSYPQPPAVKQNRFFFSPLPPPDPTPWPSFLLRM